jgi:RNA polymerase sigma-70 factor (TIGR02960 family)
VTAANDDLLTAARGGDEQAFRRLIEPVRGPLHAHCYRMLGSLSDTEDAMQETLLGAWQGLAQFEGRSSLSTWVFTIATHACLRLLSSRRARMLPPDQCAAGNPRDELPKPLTEDIWIEPYPSDRFEVGGGRASPEARYEQRESVEIAFVAALQTLPANQRAVLILRDVLGFSAQEVAEQLETSVASANSALQRARVAVEQKLPAKSQQATRRALGDEGLRLLVQRFIGAWERADVDAIVAMLANDVTFAMPPLPAWFRGKDDVRIFLVERVYALRWRFLPAFASCQPAMVGYDFRAESGSYRFGALNVFSVRGDRIAAIDAFLDPEVHARFGLPLELPG